MANLPENNEYPEGIIRLETTMTAKGGDPVWDQAGNLVDGFLNAPLQQLAERTSWLKRNSGSSGGSPVDQLPDANMIIVGQLTPGSTYVLRAMGQIMVHTDSDIPTLEFMMEEFFGMDVTLNEVPVGSEFHFICGTDPSNLFLEDLSGIGSSPDVS